MKHQMPRRLLILIPLLFCLPVIAAAQASPTAQTSGALLKELLDLPSPPPAGKSDPEERPKELYDEKNPPPDDAPIEDLLDYWLIKAIATYNYDEKRPTASVKTALRLIETVQETPSKFNGFLKILPVTAEVAERVKFLYDSKLGSDDVSDYWSKEVKEWLKLKSAYYTDELLADAQKVKDHAKYFSINKEDEMRALAEFDWERAEPLLKNIEGNKQSPWAGVLAQRFFYEHALKGPGESDTQKYRSQLKKIVENSKATGGERSLAFNALAENKSWPGFDEWFLSLFTDPSFFELRLSENATTSPLLSVTSKAPEKWMPVLVKLIGNKDRNIHVAAVDCLANINRNNPSRETASPLLPWLFDKNWAVDDGERSGFIQTLEKIDIPESIPGLIAAAEENFAAVDVLAHYKDPRAIPVLRKGLQETADERTRGRLITALIACGGISDLELVTALENYAELILTPEGRKQVLERDEGDDEDPLPLEISIGSFLGREKEPPESFVKQLFERIDTLQKENIQKAKTLLEIAAKWKGKAADAEILQRVSAGKADAGMILTILARRKEIRENVPFELSVLSGKGGLPGALGIAVSENEAQAGDVINLGDTETKIAVLALARLLRLRLSVPDVAAYLKSGNKLLALAAERYLESEDSAEARKLVLAGHPGEAMILGARDSFNPAKKSYNASTTVDRNETSPLQLLFSSVSGSYLYPENTYTFNEELDREESKLRKEILEDSNLVEIYSYGKQYLRVYKDRAVFTSEADPAFYYEKLVTKKEVESFKNGLAEGKIDELGPVTGYCHYDCSVGQFTTLNRDGGRRLFHYGGIGSSIFFWELLGPLERSEGVKLNFRLAKYFKDLALIPLDQGLLPKAVWKNGEDFRILISDRAGEERIREEIRKQDAVDDDDDDMDYGERMTRAQKRRSERKFEHYSWRKFADGALGEQVNEPGEIPFLRDRIAFPSTEHLLDSDSIWQARSGPYEIRAGLREAAGLVKVSNAESIKIADGWYREPITTPDGKWAVVSKTETNWDDPHSLYRINLTTGKKHKIDLDPAENLRAVAFVPAQGKMLILRSSENPAARYYLLDVETGKVKEVKGEFQPLVRQTFRPLQPAGKPNEFWAAVYNKDKNQTDVGIYDAKTFTLRSLLKLPEILLDSMDIWVDEKEGKLYFVYGDDDYRGSYLLSLPLPKPTGP